MKNTAPFSRLSQAHPARFFQLTLFTRALKTLSFALTCALLLQFSACAPNSPVLPEYGSLKLGVAPFTQPLKSTDLMAGYIPENQVLLSPEALAELNTNFRTLLQSSSVNLTFISPSELAAHADAPQGLSSALSRWVALGRAQGVDLVLVPQLLSWDQPNDSLASLALDFFLVDARELSTVSTAEQEKVNPMPGLSLPHAREARNALLQRWHFAEVAPIDRAPAQALPGYLGREQGVENVDSLAVQAMRQAIKELGL